MCIRDSCYTGGVAINGRAGSVSIAASNVQCFGREYSLGECQYESVVPTECTADRAAGARCAPGSSKSNLMNPLPMNMYSYHT